METRESLAGSVDTRTNLAIGLAFVGGSAWSIASGAVHWSGVLYSSLLMGLPLAGRHLAARRGTVWLRTAVPIVLFALVAGGWYLSGLPVRSGMLGFLLGSGLAVFLSSALSPMEARHPSERPQ